MKHPIILKGQAFDWEAGREALGRVIGEDGEVNWGAAFAADPGVMQCPSCGAYLWREGREVQCPDCLVSWVVPG